MSQHSHSPTEGEALISCDKLIVGYRGNGLLPALDLTIHRGELWLVVGRNGAGKSTWLKTVLGLLPPVSGQVRQRSSQRAKMSYVPQDAALDALLPVSAKRVVSWARLRGWGFLRPFPRTADTLAQKAAIDEAGAPEFIGQPFRDLSGGQRQRILFARLLASGADLALLDEPTASMDMASERRAYQQLSHLAQAHSMAVVIITHTIGIAAEYADRALFVDPGDGEDDGYKDGAVACGELAEVFAHPLFKRHFGDIPTG